MGHGCRNCSGQAERRHPDQHATRCPASLDGTRLGPQRQQLYVIPRAQSQGDITRFVLGGLSDLWIPRDGHRADLRAGHTVHRLAVSLSPDTWNALPRCGPDTDLLALGHPDLDISVLPARLVTGCFVRHQDSSADAGIRRHDAIVFPVAYVFRRTRKLKDERNDLHGSAHWAGGRRNRSGWDFAHTGQRRRCDAGRC
jgi:hypothetical protein